MALTSVTVDRSGGAIPSAPIYMDQLTAVGPASYATGGEAFNPATALLLGTDRTILSVLARGTVTTGGKPSITNYEWDRTNNLLVAMDQARVEVVNTTDLSAQTIIITVWSQ